LAAFAAQPREHRHEQPQFADAALVGKDFDEPLPWPAATGQATIERSVTRWQPHIDRRGAVRLLLRTPQRAGILLQQIFDRSGHRNSGHRAIRGNSGQFRAIDLRPRGFLPQHTHHDSLDRE
jgi:hypothetical protein